MAEQSKSDNLRAMREANWANRKRPKPNPFEDAARGRDVQPQTVARKRPAPAAMPEETSPLPAKPSAQPIKMGRPRIGEKRAKPWLDAKPPMSRSTYYRRQAEKAKTK